MRPLYRVADGIFDCWGASAHNTIPRALLQTAKQLKQCILKIMVTQIPSVAIAIAKRLALWLSTFRRPKVSILVYGEDGRAVDKVISSLPFRVRARAEIVLSAPSAVIDEVNGRRPDISRGRLRVVSAAPGADFRELALKACAAERVVLCPADVVVGPALLTRLVRTTQGPDEVVLLGAQSTAVESADHSLETRLVTDAGTANKIWQKQAILRLLSSESPPTDGLELSLAALLAGISGRVALIGGAVPEQGTSPIDSARADRLLDLDCALLSELADELGSAIAVRAVAHRMREYSRLAPYREETYAANLSRYAHLARRIISADDFARLPVATRAALLAAHEGDLERIDDFEGTFEEYFGAFLLENRAGRLVASAPWLSDRFGHEWAVGLADLQIIARLWSANWTEQDKVELKGFAYVKGFDDSLSTSLIWHIEMVVEEETINSVEISDWNQDLFVDSFAGDPLTSYSYSGFSATICRPKAGTQFRLRAESSELKFVVTSPLLRFPTTQRPLYSNSGDVKLVSGRHKQLIIESCEMRSTSRLAAEPPVVLEEVLMVGAQILLTGRTSTDASGFQVGLSHSQEMHITDPEFTKDGRWTARFDFTRSDISNRGYFVKYRRVTSTDWTMMPPGDRMVQAPMSFLVGPLKSGKVQLHNGTSVGVTLTPPVPAEHQSLRGRQLLNDRPRPELRRAIYFESFNGQSSGDNPRAIFDDLARQEQGIRLYWGVVDGTVAVPEGGEPVVIGSPEWFEAIYSSKVLVTNNHLPIFVEKSPDQYWIQTWHGAPLKPLVLAAPRSTTPLLYRRAIDRQAQQWDLLLAQDQISEQLLRRSFRYEKEVLVGEQPRNKRLLAPDSRRRVRKELGIAENEFVALYAPTWRPDTGESSEAANLTHDANALCETGTTILLRRHHMTPKKGMYAPGVVDVSRYPFIEDLMVASDLLISDYSSAIIDYRLLGKPVLCYVPDPYYLKIIRPQLERIPAPLLEPIASLNDLIPAVRDVRDREPRVPDTELADSVNHTLSKIRQAILLQLEEVGGA